jgi:hypothetical protein
MENQKTGRIVTGRLQPMTLAYWPSSAAELAHGTDAVRVQCVVTTPGSRAWRHGGMLVSGAAATGRR